mgnify:CR=1 FL=1
MCIATLGGFGREALGRIRAGSIIDPDVLVGVHGNAPPVVGDLRPPVGSLLAQVAHDTAAAIHPKHPNPPPCPGFAASIGVITGVDFWGKGYGMEAHELLLEFLFEERGVQVVRLWIQAGGERGVAAAEKLGFKISSRFREGSVIGGKLVDGIFMDMLREEYYESRGKVDHIPPVV